MRSLWLLAALGLVAVVAAQEQQPAAAAAAVVAEEDDDLGELEHDDNFRNLFADILSIEADEDDDEEGSFRQSRGMAGEEEDVTEEKAIQDPKDLQRYNAFIDTFFRRLNSYARSNLDPVSVALTKREAKANKKNAKDDDEDDKKKNKKGARRLADSDKKGKGKGKKGEKKGKANKKAKNNKNKNNKNNNKKNNRHPKSLDLEEAEDEAEEAVEEVEEEEAVRQKREVNEAEELEEEEEDEDEESSRVARAAGDEEDAEEAAEEGKARRNEGGQQRKNKNKNKKNKNKKAGKNAARSKRESKSKKDDKKAKNNKKDNKKADKNERRAARAAVSGLATVRREGDVKVQNAKNGKVIKADFTLGPVALKLTRQFGKGKDALARTAKASSDKLEGQIAIKLTADGEATVSAFKVKRPDIVRVEGSLARKEKADSRDNLVKNSMNRFTPYAALRLKRAAREVLKAAEPKRTRAQQAAAAAAGAEKANKKAQRKAQKA